MSSDSAYGGESELRPGQVFAERYQILDPLPGSIGSAIYHAVDETAHQTVVLKLIRPTIVPRNSDVLTRYRLDLNSMRQIAHESVVRVSDFGEYAGSLYLALEAVDGTTLSNYLKLAEKLSVSEFFKLFDILCDALSQLHARNVIHRDLHPGNILVTAAGSLKLMDFGVDRDLKHTAKANTVQGLEYAAPEQLAGHAPTVTTDIYSLGAICYTMLTGRRPLSVAMTSYTKQWTSSEQLGQELRGLPAGLVTVLEKCLQRDPGKRYRSVSALQEAVSALQNAHVAQSSRVSLDSLRKTTPTDPDMCVRIFLKIIASLREMHAADQSHAELSPQKIWLHGDAVEIDRALPVAGQGTLLIPDAKYSAPELLMAQTAPDQASHTGADIYVLGLNLYELLAGNTKMEEQFANFAHLRSGLGWMRWHVEPGQKLQPLIKLFPDFPDALSDLLERMLEKNPAKRIRDLDEIETKLKALRVRMEKTDQFVTGPVIPEPVSAKKKPARLRVLALLTALMVASLAGGGWWLNKGAHLHVLNGLNRLPDSSFKAALVKWQSWHVKKVASPVLSTPVAASPVPSGPPPVTQTSTGIMLLIPQGEFVMGDDAVPNAAPAHKVSLPAYYIDRLEVSNREYRKFCHDTGRSLPSKPAWDPGYFGKDEYPVINVTWQDAKAFCESYNQRLPSEAEWEKAARGTETFIHWANWTLPGLANIWGVAGRRPAPVGSFPADVSPYAVLDLAGNVQEWVNDSFRSYGKTSDAASGEDGRKLVRGGSYATDTDGLSPASRGWVAEGSGPAQSSFVGFRCAADTAKIAVEQP